MIANFCILLPILSVFVIACAIYLGKKPQRPVKLPVLIVGISGKIGSGKSTLASNIVKKIGNKLKVYERSFGDELKTALSNEYGFDISLCYSQEGKNTVPPGCTKTVGQLLQQYGTAKREINEDIWVEAVQDYVDNLSTSENMEELYDQGYEGLLFIIPDVRLPNEAAWLKEEGKIIRLNGDPRSVFATTTRDKNHISETALDNYNDFDLIIDSNYWDEEECFQKAKDFIFTCQT